MDYNSDSDHSDWLSQIELKLRSEALNQRKDALDELAQAPADLALPVLQRLAAEPDFMRRRLAVMGLGNHRSEAAFEMLQAILIAETDANVLAEAANSIFEFGAAALPDLLSLLERSSDWLVRQTVLSLLIEAEPPELLLKAVQISLQDEAESVREAAILALNPLLKTACQEQALALLSQLAQDADWRVRWRTATALSGAQQPQAKTLLHQLQTDEHFRVVAAALDALAQG